MMILMTVVSLETLTFHLFMASVEIWVGTEIYFDLRTCLEIFDSFILVKCFNSLIEVTSFHVFFVCKFNTGLRRKLTGRC